MRNTFDGPFSINCKGLPGRRSSQITILQADEFVLFRISGTYNSQYMVVDLSRVSLGHSIRNGALTVVEQIPGKVMQSDQTQALRRGKKQTLSASVCMCLKVFSFLFF